ncbi:glycosyltransferase family 2 protein [sulfur-oxidizing endosymbiont of Gigantopelta aegis]|uniref:glycosyltransferase family 2 protein n=1 Tax=sulfur-oxidizing endosymbiont of Gigantopelta aegis TaxID=2794934 RepID=UPI0018DDD0E7|nr:glycosyltransferase family A protein [sulfur-oxidizing endosymbiont of Gigantopelta aegis]
MIELSIIVPTHARPRELVRCLKSIQNCQLRSYEIILVADINDPKTSEIAGEYLRNCDYYVIRGGKPGPAESRNLGIKMASGHHILIFDDDDALPDSDYQAFVDAALSNPHDVIYGNVNFLKEDREKDIIFPDPPISHAVIANDFPNMYVKNFIYTQACIFPAEAIKQVSQDTHMRSFEDWEFLLAVASKTNFKPINLLGAIIYKDYINKGNRRSTTDAAKDFELVLDYLYVYRRWPAPNEKLKAMRSEMLESQGLTIAKQYL